LPGQRLLQAVLKVPRGIQVQLGVGEKGGIEEGKALNVIPMGMPQQEVEAQRPLRRA
jgi:hypothetical protein